MTATLTMHDAEGRGLFPAPGKNFRNSLQYGIIRPGTRRNGPIFSPSAKGPPALQLRKLDFSRFFGLPKVRFLGITLEVAHRI
jgi:hypothetical protein